MSSQIKIVLKDSVAGGIWTGSSAIAQVLQKYIAPQILKIDFPVGWLKLTKIKKLKFLMEYAPKTLKLTVIQQPRGTRPSKSLYNQLRNGDKPAVPGVRVANHVLHNGNLIQGQVPDPVFRRQQINNDEVPEYIEED